MSARRREIMGYRAAVLYLVANTDTGWVNDPDTASIEADLIAAIFDRTQQEVFDQIKKERAR